jgi:hypothetical protein
MYLSALQIQLSADVASAAADRAAEQEAHLHGRSELQR